jgi:hypothetical protein
MFVYSDLADWVFQEFPRGIIAVLLHVAAIDDEPVGRLALSAQQHRWGHSPCLKMSQ